MTDRRRVEQVAEDLEACKMTMSNDIKLLRADINLISTDIGEILAVSKALKGFAKVMGWFTTALIWAAKIGAVSGAIWLAIKGIVK